MSSIRFDRLPSVIEPNKFVLEDLEILAFENEEQLNLYSVWNELLFDSRLPKHDMRRIYPLLAKQANILPSTSDGISNVPQDSTLQPHKRSSSSKSARTSNSSHTNNNNNNNSQKTLLAAYTPVADHGTLSNGLSIINSSHYNTLPNCKQLMKYKLTKLYNKYRGRQMRRNLVLERLRNAKIEEYVGKSYLNSWLTYTALQALRFNSNRINPQQVAEYKRKSHLLPSSASSKKSSAASYNVYEIMEVLANTNKTNVTISRNSNKNNQNATTTYSHSINANVPGIVSTQLHLQAKSYLDSMRKFYIEERQVVDKEAERLRSCPSVDEIVGQYINVDHSYSSHAGSSHNSSPNSELVTPLSRCREEEVELADENGTNNDSGIKMECIVADGTSELIQGDVDEIEMLEDDVFLTLKEFNKGKCNSNNLTSSAT